MEIYLDLTKKTQVSQKKIVKIKDISEIVGENNSVVSQINDLSILTIQTDKKQNHLISFLDVVKKIKKLYPQITIHNVGEKEAIIEYTPVQKKESCVLQYTKVIIISVILFSGSATAIMSFHADAQLPDVFAKYYYIFFGEENKAPWIIDIPYSIGLATGIIVFFNHFGGKKLTDDPTPIEVEMSLYEDDVNTTIAESLSAKKENKEDPLKKLNEKGE